MSNPITAAIAIASVTLALVVGVNCFTIPSVNHQAAATSFGEVVEGKVIEGFTIIPFWWSITEYNNAPSTYSFDDLGVASQDKFKTNMDLSFTGAFSKGQADQIRKNGSAFSYLETHVNRRVLSCVTKAGGEVVDSQAFFEKPIQEQLAQSTLDCVNAYLDTVGGYTLSSVQFSDIRLDPKVKEFMVQTKARQEAENQATSDLNIAEKKAQEVVKQAEAARSAAAANKDAQKLNSEARFYDIQLQAKGNLELARSVTPELVEYTKAKSWNGVLPTHTLGSNTSTFIK